MSEVAAASLRPAKRLSLGQSVAEILREAIYRGRFRPGERIAQALIAQEMNVSQTTVRDALATLENEGLVKRGVNQGAVVTRLSPSDIEEIVSLRTALEVMAIRLVIRKASSEQLELLEENIRTMNASAGADRVAELDLEFHELLVRFADHKRLLISWKALLSQLKLLLVSHNLRDRTSRQKTIQNHAQLIKLMKSGDESRAAEHIARSNNVYRVHAVSE